MDLKLSYYNNLKVIGHLHWGQGIRTTSFYIFICVLEQGFKESWGF
jgi:hypothetical protein